MNRKIVLHACFLLIISIASPLFASDGERGAGKNFVMYIQEQYGYAPYAFRTKEGSYLSISRGDTIRKISESGELLWQRTTWTQGANIQYVWLEGIAETADGYVLAGSTWDWNDIPTGLIIKLGSDGSVQWSKTFQSQENVGFHSVSSTADGGYIVQGYSWPPHGTSLVKITTNGDVLWSKIFDNLRSLNGASGASVSDGIILVSADEPIRILKVNHSGSIVWQEFLQNNGFHLQSMAASSENGVILAGKSSGRLILVRMSSDGKVDWNSAYIFKDPWDEISSVVTTSDNGYVVLGTKFSGAGKGGFIIKIDSKQQLVFHKQFGRSDRNEYAGHVFPIADGGYAIFGRSEAESRWDTLFVTVNSEGIVPGCSFVDSLNLQKLFSPSPVVVGRSHDITSRNLALTAGTIETSLKDSTTSSTTTCPPPQSDAPGLIGTFSGTVQNTDHTKSGTLTISITAYDRYSGLLTGNLSLTGFPNCFSKGVFPHSRRNIYDNHYSPSRGFGSINAVGPKEGSHSFLYFMKSDDFHQGLNLNGITETLAFYDGKSWCLEIDPVVLKRK